MAEVISLIADFGYWAWLIVGLALIALETVVPGVHFLWFGVAALIMGLLIVVLDAMGYSGLLPGYVQLVIYACISVASVFWMRHVSAGSPGASGDDSLNQGGGQYVGRVVVVEDAISEGRGRVRVGDTIWSAKGTDAEKGARVRVIDSDGPVLVVEKT